MNARSLNPVAFLVTSIIVASAAGAAAAYLHLARDYPMAERPVPQGPLRPLHPNERGSATDRTVVMLVFDIDVHPTIAMLFGIEPGHPLDGDANRQLLAAPSD